MENIGYILLGVVAIAWFIAILVGMVAAFPFGDIRLISHFWLWLPVCESYQRAHGKQGRQILF